MRKFNQMTEKQMSKTNGGELLTILVLLATVLAGFSIGIGVDQGSRSSK